VRQAPPVLARVYRGPYVESLHRGSIAVVDEGGHLVDGCGSPEDPIFVRSAAKPFQALPLLLAGGERRFRLGDQHIALMCASHGGEPRHVRVAESILRRGGFELGDLVCGAHWPMHEPSARALARRGAKPTALHNNCSGKHAGILLACRLFGYSPQQYWEPAHPIQREILRRVSALCGIPPRRIGIAIDGCNLPVFRLPIRALARGYARFVAPAVDGEPPESAAARRRVVRAMTSSPGMVAGRGRFTTAFLEAGGGRWVGKEGAEGVYGVAILPSRRHPLGVGVAVKVEDGSTRPRDAITLAALDRLGVLAGTDRRNLSGYRFPILRNVRGTVVGAIETEVRLSTAP